MRQFKALALCCAALLLVWPNAPVRAQGCILARQCAANLGGLGSPYLAPGEWQFDSTLRWLDAWRHYNGQVEQVQRALLHNNVVNRQRLLELGGDYGVTDRLAVSLGIPVLLHGSWSLPIPTGNPPTPLGPRYTQNSWGIGDITLNARYWLLSPSRNMKQNISLGVGIQAPTGDPDVKSNFPDLTGKNIALRSVDPSIQPGLGAWAFPVDLRAFKEIGNCTLYTSGTYLITPTNVNGTLSPISNLKGSLSPGQLYQKYDSVPDQYI
ncbi:MAG TPA: transporter, partial [Chthonomonadales bacterium]|nr:transporter [Chthonomonadales bacterium]